MYYRDVLIMLACAVLYYRIGEMEYQKGFLLGSISILVWVGTSLGLNWSLFANVGAQVGIFVVLTIINVLQRSGSK